MEKCHKKRTEIRESPLLPVEVRGIKHQTVPGGTFPDEGIRYVAHHIVFAKVLREEAQADLKERVVCGTKQPLIVYCTTKRRLN